MASFYDAIFFRLFVGFIAKERAKEILLECEPGTFLLRFSSGKPKAISICFTRVDRSGNYVSVIYYAMSSLRE